MKIEKIEIKGLFGKKDICWKLNPQVNVLVGVNGSGKSTILLNLYGVLKERSPAKNFKLLDSFIITFSNEIILKTKSAIPKDLLTQLDGLVSSIKKHYPTLNIIDKFDYITELDGNASNFIFLDDLYIDLIEANMTNSNANQTFTRSNRETENVLDLEIRETIDELNKIKTDELITRLSGSLNVFFNQIGKHVSYENNELVYTDTQLQQKLNYSHLSSGERQLIYILLRVALSNGDKSKTAIILMDEPEISLHLDWQEHFIKQLTILNPDAQFIIVTHSPALIMNGWNDVYVDMEEITTWQ